MRTPPRSLCGMALFLALTGAAGAQTKALVLPTPCVDFALDSDTGSLAAVDAAGNAVLLFRAAAWQSGGMEPTARVAVGSTPMAVVFKHFGDRRVFVVACEKDSHLYVLNAADGALVKKIPIASVGVVNLATSINPDDPFVYYNFGRGHDSMAGAISLRTLEDLGGIIKDSADCAISASGDMAYRRGPWSPSGFESLLRRNGPDAVKPNFQRFYYEHTSTDPYVPDPFDRYTAVGKRIYSRSLEKAVADVEFVPLCWFRTRPLVVGIVPTDDGRSQPGSKQRVLLRAASTNTFRPAGDLVTIDLDPAAKADAVPPTPPAGRRRMFAFDAGKCLLYAHHAHLAVVPLTEFRAGVEPFLTGSLSGGEALFCERENVLKLTTADPQVKARFESLPDGMKASGNELRWRPGAEQIGPTKVVVSFELGELQYLQTFNLAVKRPSIPLPFDPTGCAAAADGRTALIWEGPAVEGFGPPRRPAAGPESFRMAAIDLPSGTMRVEKRMPEGVLRAALIGDWACIFTQNAERCDVHDMATLERRKSLVAAAPIVGIGSCPGGIVLQTQTGLEVFDATTLERRSRHAGSPPGIHGRLDAPTNTVTSTMLTPRGVISDGVLLDAAGKPALMIASTGWPALPWGDRGQRPAFLTAAIQPLAAAQPAGHPFARDGSEQKVATVPIPQSTAVATLEQRWTHRPVPNAVHTSRMDFELLVTASGDRPLRALLLKQENMAGRSDADEPVRAALCATPDAVVATYAGRLYRLPLPQPVGVGKTRAVAMTPRQSALMLAADGPTTLRHAAEGGQPPMKFSLPEPHAGISIDEATGTVTVEREPVLDEAVRLIEKLLGGQPVKDGSYVDAYRTMVAAGAARIAELIGRPPAGCPVMVPIRITVTDASGGQDTLQYAIFAEVPEGLIVPRLQKLDADRPRPAPQIAAVPPAPPGRMPQDDAAMARRLDALEQRVDLMTRQLNEILRRLENK